MAPTAVQWTETEINILIQAWSEVDAQFPTQRCKRGTGTYRKKLFALFSRRSTYPRSFSGINHIQYALRDYALFVHQFDSDQQNDRGRFWYDLDKEEREQYRAEVPHNSRGVMSTVSRETFGRLMQMERAKKWIGGVQNALATNQRELVQTSSGEICSSVCVPAPVSETQPSQPKLVPSSPDGREQIASGADEHGYSQLSDVTSEIEQDNEMELAAQDPPSGDLSSSIAEVSSDGASPLMPTSSAATTLISSLGSAESNVDGSPPSNAEPEKRFKSSQAKRKVFKHRDCNILLENMMELQNRQIRRSVRKLRAGIEGEVRRSTEMLRSIITNQFDDPSTSGDVAFVTKVLDMQDQQLKARFDRFEDNRKSDEVENRVMLGQRFGSEN